MSKRADISLDSSATFAQLLKELLKKTGQSYRKVARKAGISHSSISKYLSGEARPSRDVCIALADYFGINPNEMLVAAGYKPLALFEEGPLEPGQVSRDIEELAAKIDQIRDPRIRRRLIDAMKILLDVYLPPEPAKTSTRKPVLTGRRAVAKEEEML